MESPAEPGTSVIRRNRPMAVTARLASQPYPIIAKRTQAWVEGLEDKPRLRGLNPMQESSTTPQENANPATVADRMDEEDYTPQHSFADIQWEIETVSSIPSMYDWNGHWDKKVTVESPNAVVTSNLSLHGRNDDGEQHAGSVDLPPLRSVTPPPRDSPRKRKRCAKRKADLDEDYDPRQKGISRRKAARSVRGSRKSRVNMGSRGNGSSGYA